MGGEGRKNSGELHQQQHRQQTIEVRRQPQMIQPQLQPMMQIPMQEQSSPLQTLEYGQARELNLKQVEDTQVQDQMQMIPGLSKEGNRRAEKVIKGEKLSEKEQKEIRDAEEKLDEQVQQQNKEEEKPEVDDEPPIPAFAELCEYQKLLNEDKDSASKSFVDVREAMNKLMDIMRDTKKKEEDRGEALTALRKASMGYYNTHRGHRYGKKGKRRKALVKEIVAATQDLMLGEELSEQMRGAALESLQKDDSKEGVKNLQYQDFLRKFKEDQEKKQGLNKNEEMTLEKAQQEQRERAQSGQDGGVGSLSYADFVAVLGTLNRGQVEFSKGELRVVNNHWYNASKTGKATVENRRVRERFLDVTMEKIGDKMDASVLLRLRGILGLDGQGDASLPLSRETIRSIANYVNERASEVTKILNTLDVDINQGAKYDIAKFVNVSLGGLRDIRKHSPASKDAQDNMLEDAERLVMDRGMKGAVKTQIQRLLKISKERWDKTLTLSDHQMDNLVNGNLGLLRDNVYNAIYKTYSLMWNLNGGNATLVDSLGIGDDADGSPRMARYTTAVIAVMTARNKKERALAEMELQKLIEETAFALHKECNGIDDSAQRAAADANSVTKEEYQLLHVGGLASKGSAGLEELVEERSVSAWKKDEQKKQRGTQKLVELCNALEIISVMRVKGLYTGLDDTQAEQMIQAGQKAQEMLNDPEAMEDMEFVAKELKGTRFASGFQEFKRLAQRRDEEIEKLRKEVAEHEQKLKKAQEVKDSSAVNVINRSVKYGKARIDVISKEKKENFFADMARRMARGTTTNGKYQDIESQKLEKINLRNKSKEMTADEIEDEAQLIKEKKIEEEQRILLSRMGEDAREVVRALLNKNTFSVYVNGKLEQAKKNNGGKIPKGEAERYTKGFLEINKWLYEVSKMPGTAQMLSVTIGDLDVQMLKRTDGVVEVMSEGVNFELPFAAVIMADRMEMDLVSNEKLYGRGTIRNILKKLTQAVKDGADAGVQTRAREACYAYLKNRMNIESTFFFSVSTEKLLEYATHAVDGTMTMKDIRKDIIDTDNTERINGAETLELLAMAEKNKQVVDKKVAIKPYQPVVEEKQDQWTKEEEQMKNLLADFIYTQDTWLTDNAAQDKGSRLLNVCKKNIDAFMLIVDHPEKFAKMIEKMPLPGMEEGGMKDMIMEKMVLLSAEINQKLKEAKEEQEREEEEEREKQKEQGGSIFGGFFSNLEKKFKKAVINNRKAAVLGALVREETKKKFRQVDEELDKAINEATEKLQSVVNEMADSAFQAGEKTDVKDYVQQRKQSKQEKTWEDVERENGLLEDIVKESLSGTRGQGKFMRNVLTTYFSGVSVLDKRSMLGAVLRYAKPRKALPKDATEEQRDEAQAEMMGEALGNMLKGSGPLMQKMMQGIPKEHMPTPLRVALEDMKSNLAPIPMEIVKEQMWGIVERSHGQIERIEVVRALGAASIGQAFLCKLYGPGMQKSGKKVVVKLLRPDVRNRMMREKKIMLKAARDTDEGGGMEATYQGQLQRIEEELDLTLEAKNVELGNVYDIKGGKDIKAMKVNKAVAPTSNTLVLDLAEGETVDQYLKRTRDEYKDCLEPLYGKNSEMDPNGIKIDSEKIKDVALARQKLAEMIPAIQARQQNLVKMAKIWVEEGLFGKGFYHGDLHAGNIIVNDKELTVIDFGNATKLTEEQQSKITLMMAAAMVGDVKDFLEGYYALLNEENKKKFNANDGEMKKKLEEEFGDLFSLGHINSAMPRIMAALSKAQEIGLEAPGAVQNFAQCMFRLTATIDEMNSMLVAAQNQLIKLEKMDWEQEPADIEMNVLKHDRLGLDKVKQLSDDTNESACAAIIGGMITNAQGMIENLLERDTEEIPQEMDAKAYVQQRAYNEMFENEEGKKAEKKPKKKEDKKEDKKKPKSIVITPVEGTLGRCAALLEGLEKQVAPEKLVQELEKTVEKAMDFYDFEESELFSKLEADVRRFAQDPANNGDALKSAVKNIQDRIQRHLDFKVQSRKEFAETKAIKDKEACETLRAELKKKALSGASYLHRLRSEKLMKSRPFVMVKEAVADVSQREKTRKTLENWFRDEGNFGSELKAAYEEYCTAQDSNALDTRFKLNKFMHLYRNALYQRIARDEKAEKASEKVRYDIDPYTAVDAVGMVLSDHMSTALFRLGLGRSVQYSMAISKGSEEITALQNKAKKKTDQK